MIIEYHRPATLPEALQLIGRDTPNTLPLAGGTLLNLKNDTPLHVVDIQDLGLNRIEKRGDELLVGAAVTLQQLLEHPETPESIRAACKKENSYNLRVMATLGGCIAAGGGRSGLLAVLMSSGAKVDLAPGNVHADLNDLMPRRKNMLQKKLITSVEIPLDVQTAAMSIQKTKSDLPIAGVSLSKNRAGMIKAVVFGCGATPVVAGDHTTAGELTEAVRQAFLNSDDVNASAAYRMDQAGVMVKRCLAKLNGEVQSW